MLEIVNYLLIKLNVSSFVHNRNKQRIFPYQKKFLINRWRVEIVLITTARVSYSLDIPAEAKQNTQCPSLLK